MKQTIIIFIVAALVLVSTALWFFSSEAASDPMELVQLVVIILVVGFAIFLGVRMLKGVRRGEPVEDELTRRVLQRSAATAYYISLFIWVFLLYLKDRVTFDTEVLLGTGILGMAVAFAVCWVIYYLRGLRNG